MKSLIISAVFFLLIPGPQISNAELFDKIVSVSTHSVFTGPHRDTVVSIELCCDNFIIMGTVSLFSKRTQVFTIRLIRDQHLNPVDLLFVTVAKNQRIRIPILAHETLLGSQTYTIEVSSEKQGFIESITLVGISYP